MHIRVKHVNTVEFRSDGIAFVRHVLPFELNARRGAEEELLPYAVRKEVTMVSYESMYLVKEGNDGRRLHKVSPRRLGLLV